jgi:hypothetical protein
MHADEDVCLSLHDIYIGKYDRRVNLKDLGANGRVKYT